MTLADRIEVVLVERGASSRGALARELRKRDADVLGALRSDPRFVRTGKTKASRWDVRRSSFDAAEAACRWDCDTETATEIIFGPEGFLELGLVSSLNGNGRVIVTDLGCSFAALVEAVA